MRTLHDLGEASRDIEMQILAKTNLQKINICKYVSRKN